MQWLVDELNKRYDVPRKVAQAWIASDMILSLLDGLDEVNGNVRSACAEVINTYRQEHGLLPLVVSSRIADYDALSVKLRLHGAIVVEPLTREQVKAYLRQMGLRVTPSNTSLLWELLDTPLMLNIAALTYAGQAGQPLPTDGTPEAQRDQLFTAYVEHMFDRRPARQRFLQDRTLHWLTWLAWQMQHHNQTVFYLEHLQPEWLPTRRARWQYALLDRVGFGLGVGLVFGLVFGLGYGLAEGLGYGLGYGLGVGLFFGLLVALFGQVGLQPKTSALGVAQRIWNALLGGLVFGLVFGLGVGLLFGLEWGLRDGLEAGLQFGLVFGQFGILAGALISGPHIRPRRITAVEALRWSWPQAWRSLLTGLVVGLVMGLIMGLIMGLEVGLGYELGYGLRYGLVFGLVFGLIGGLIGGLTSHNVEQNVLPNQSIRRSARMR